MEFIVSKKELNRRKKAFSILLVNLAIGIFLFSCLFNLPIPLAGLLIISVIFLIIYLVTFQYFFFDIANENCILDRKIERQKEAHYETYFISEINSLKIKRRKDGPVREIYIIS